MYTSIPSNTRFLKLPFFWGRVYQWLLDHLTKFTWPWVRVRNQRKSPVKCMRCSRCTVIWNARLPFDIHDIIQHTSCVQPLRFCKGFNNLRERTSRFRHFYLARRAQSRTQEPHIKPWLDSTGILTKSPRAIRETNFISMFPCLSQATLY